MDAADVIELIREGETATVECKVNVPRTVELAQRLCGFANGQGGYLVIGVADTTWEIVGVNNVGMTVDFLLQASRLCKPPIHFTPAAPDVVDVQGKKVVVATVPPNDGVLYQTSGVFYIRRGTLTVPLDISEIEAFLHTRGTLAWELRPVPHATLDDLDPQLIEAYVSQRPGRSRESGRLADAATLLQQLGCAAQVREDDGTLVVRPTHAGLLLFGRNPHDFVMQAETICVLMGDDLGLQRYRDRRILVGTLTQQIDQAEDFFRANIRTGAVMDGFHRRDRPDYPLEALREAVVNAVVHRDYSLRGEAVRIFFYPDHIEIHNPGLLPPGIRLTDLQQGNVPSQPRNPTLAGVLRDMPGGYMERLGSGIRFMLNQMRSLDKPLPQFREQNEVIVTFYRDAPAQERPPALPRSVVPPQPVAAPPQPAPVAAPVQSQAERYMLALQYVQEHGAISNKSYRELTGVSVATAFRDLDMLVQRGSLRIVGKGRNSKYVR